MIIPEAIQKALDHVRYYLPQVTKVEYTFEGDYPVWIYLDDNNVEPSFEGVPIDTNILKEGLDAMWETGLEFPFIFPIQGEQDVTF